VPDRSVAALCDAARGWRLQRSLYNKLVLAGVGEEISDDSATLDLKALVDAGLLAPKGEKRGRTYLPTEVLRAAGNSIREQRPPRPEEDPYESAGQARLDSPASDLTPRTDRQSPPVSKPRKPNPLP